MESAALSVFRSIDLRYGPNGRRCIGRYNDCQHDSLFVDNPAMNRMRFTEFFEGDGGVYP